MSNVVSLCIRPLFLRSRAGVFAARRCIARNPYGVDGAAVALLRGVRRDGVPDTANRLGVRGYLV